MKRILFALLLLAFTPINAQANEPAIEAGFNAFKETGVEAAWKTWAKGGPLEGTKEIMSQASQFGQIGTFYGEYNGHEYVFKKVLGPRNKIVLVIMNLEKGPLFGRFLMFKNSAGAWTIPNFRFHTDPEQVWPSEVFSK